MYEYANREVPYLKDYESAVARFEAIRPLQSGPAKGKSPIGQRRKTWQHIWMTPDGVVKISEGNGSQVWTEISYYKNNVIMIHSPNGNLGITSMAFVGHVVGIELNRRGNRLWVHGVTALKVVRKWPREEERIYGSFPLLNTNLRLRRDNNQLVLQNASFPQVRTINRAGAKAVREKYKDFSLYMQGLYGVKDHGWTEAEYVDAGVGVQRTIKPEELLAWVLSDEPHDNLRAAMRIARTNQRRRYYRYDPHAQDTTWEGTKLRALAAFDKMILDAHSDQAYAWEPRFDGKVYIGPIKLGAYAEN